GACHQVALRAPPSSTTAPTASKPRERPKRRNRSTPVRAGSRTEAPASVPDVLGVSMVELVEGSTGWFPPPFGLVLFSARREVLLTLPDRFAGPFGRTQQARGGGR